MEVLERAATVLLVETLLFLDSHLTEIEMIYNYRIFLFWIVQAYPKAFSAWILYGWKIIIESLGISAFDGFDYKQDWKVSLLSSVLRAAKSYHKSIIMRGLGSVEDLIATEGKGL